MVLGEQSKLYYYCAQKNMNILVLTAITIITHTLHLQSDYLSSLRNTHHVLIAHAIQMQQAFDHNNPQSLSANTIDDKIKIIEHLLLTQRIHLLDIIQQHHYNLNTTPWTCEPFSPIAQLHLRHSYHHIQLKFKQLNAYLHTNVPTAANKPTADLSDRLQRYLTNRQSAYFSPSIGKEQSFKGEQMKRMTNLNAGMWGLGNITTFALTQQLIKHPSPEFCPFDIPFADKQGRCKQCPKQRPYFILQGHSCFNCYTYDTSKRQCLDEKGNVLAGTVLFTNYAAAKHRILLLQNQTILQFASNTQNLTLCPPNLPFFDGKQCIDCQNEYYFSPSEHTCTSCPSDYYYEPKSMNCKKAKYYSRADHLSWVSESRKIEDILQQISLKKSEIQYRQCPQKTPFSIGSSCIGCAKPTHFSYDTFKCQSCPYKTILDLNMHRCMPIANINYQTNPMTSPKLVLNGKTLNEWANTYYTNTGSQPGIEDCPPATPYFDGIACIVCPHSHPYFNLDKLVCQYCPGTTIYDQGLRQCISRRGRAVQVPTWEKMAAAVFS